MLLFNFVNHLLLLKHPDSCNNNQAVWADIDGWEIMRQCTWKRIGYLGKEAKIIFIN
jgi:hypothetical protein